MTHPTDDELEAVAVRLDRNGPSHVDADIWMSDAAAMLRACKTGDAAIDASNRRADLCDPMQDERVKALVEALNHIDALDPEDMVYGCTPDALRGLVIRMGQFARAALRDMGGGNAK
jgi:hypothetical protein